MNKEIKRTSIFKRKDVCRFGSIFSKGRKIRIPYNMNELIRKHIHDSLSRTSMIGNINTEQFHDDIKYLKNVFQYRYGFRKRDKIRLSKFKNIKKKFIKAFKSIKK